MDLHHLHFVAGRSVAADGTTVYNSIAVGKYCWWEGPSPMEGCPDFPIDDMDFIGCLDISKEALCLRVSSKDPDYVTGEVYRNYSTDEDTNLDMFLRRGDRGRWRLYKLRMPLNPPAGYDVADGPYPQPAHWYRAFGKKFVRYVADDELEAIRTVAYATTADASMGGDTAVGS